jgi:hypothetical protein
VPVSVTRMRREARTVFAVTMPSFAGRLRRGIASPFLSARSHHGTDLCIPKECTRRRHAAASGEQGFDRFQRCPSTLLRRAGATLRITWVHRNRSAAPLLCSVLLGIHDLRIVPAVRLRSPPQGTTEGTRQLVGCQGYRRSN